MPGSALLGPPCNRAGEGGDTEVLEAAREVHQQRQRRRRRRRRENENENEATMDRIQAREERQERVVKLLVDHGLFSFYA